MPKPTPMPIGVKYGRLTVIGDAGDDGHRHRRVRCRCLCGAERIVTAYQLRNGHTRSCGCLRDEVSGVRAKGMAKHGHFGSITYNSWCSMWARTKRRPGYADRGISVCARWIDFQSFLDDMGERPSKDHSLDRINNDGNYEPDNCRWATWTEQAQNRRRVTRRRKRNEAGQLV